MMVLCGTYLLLGGQLSNPCIRAIPCSRFSCVRPADFRTDKLYRVPLFFHCRWTHPFLDERAGDERRTAIPAAGDIRFEHVSFAYQDKEVLHDINITLPKNSLTALVGPSEAGKVR